MPSPRNNSKWFWLGCGGGLILLALFACWCGHGVNPRRPAAGTQKVPAPVSPAAENPVLQTALENLRASADGKIARQNLEVLRGKLAALPKAEAVALIRQFLDGKTDAPTHLGFKVAANGSLSDAPTLRTFLLDELARIDPQAAAEYSKIILASMDSPDEWAVALRNLLRGDTSDDAKVLAKEKFMQMLQSSGWQQSPSIGYLEAFDVAVQLGDPDFVPPLTALVTDQDNPAVAHAAYLSLDRMVIGNPVQTLTALAANPQAMQGREQTRADYFARLDVRDPAQLTLLENYLINPQLGAAELQQFMGTYPNANFMISPNLLTVNATPDHAALASRDAASLQVLDQWLADPRFAALRPQLGAARQRLQGFVNQENGNP